MSLSTVKQGPVSLSTVKQGPMSLSTVKPFLQTTIDILTTLQK